MTGWLRKLFGGAPKAGEWAVATGEENGHPVVLRTRTSAPHGMTSDAYPAAVELVWRYGAAGEGGMPSAELSSSMAECEDLLATLEGPGSGLLGITITGNGRREWVWYVKDPESFCVRAQDLLARSGSRFPVEVRIPASQA